MKSIFRLRGLLRCDKRKKQAFCSVFFKDSYKLSTLDTHGRKHEEKDVLGERDVEYEAHDEEANPRERRSVMKSSVEATHPQRVVSTGSGEKQLQVDGFSDRDSRRFEEDRGGSRDSDH